MVGGSGGGGEVGDEYREDYTSSRLRSKCHDVLTPMLDKRRKQIHAVHRAYACGIET